MNISETAGEAPYFFAFQPVARILPFLTDPESPYVPLRPGGPPEKAHPKPTGAWVPMG